MKRVAIFGKELNSKYVKDVVYLVDYLRDNKVELQVHKKYLEKLKEVPGFDDTGILPFSSARNKISKPDLLISIGGDGTFLDSSLMLKGG